MDTTTDRLEQAQFLAKQARSFAQHLSAIRSTHKRKHGNMYSLTRRAFHRALRREHLVVQIEAAIEREFINKNFGHLSPEDGLRAICAMHTISPQELERRTRAQQRLKEVYSSIPWYRQQGEKYGDQFWERLHSKAPLSD